jgi:hypothetical protein
MLSLCCVARCLFWVPYAELEMEKARAFAYEYYLIFGDLWACS